MRVGIMLPAASIDPSVEVVESMLPKVVFDRGDFGTKDAGRSTVFDQEIRPHAVLVSRIRV